MKEQYGLATAEDSKALHDTGEQLVAVMVINELKDVVMNICRLAEVLLKEEYAKLVKPEECDLLKRLRELAKIAALQLVGAIRCISAIMHGGPKPSDMQEYLSELAEWITDIILLCEPLDEMFGHATGRGAASHD